MRDLPPEIPQEIQAIIKKRWNGSLPEFALASGLKHSLVHSVLCRSNHRKLSTLESLAVPLGMGIDTLAKMLLIEDVDKRKRIIETALDGRSMRQWASESGVSPSATVLTVNSLDHTQLSNVVKVANALDLSLEAFFRAYKEHTSRTA